MMNRLQTAAAVFVVLAAATVHSWSDEVAKAAAHYAQHEKVYEAVAAGHKIAIFYTQEAFDPARHSIKPDPDRRGAVIVDGKPVVLPGGKDALTAGAPMLSAMEVWFGERRVDVPANVLHRIAFFQPDAAFTIEHASMLVHVSVDGKAVAIRFKDGDYDVNAVVTVAENGRVKEGLPNCAFPVSREFMAVLADGSASAKVSDADGHGKTIATVKAGEEFVAGEGYREYDYLPVTLASGVSGVMAKKAVRLLPQEPPMKKQTFDGKALLQELKTHGWDVEGPPKGYPAPYIAAFQKALAGDERALATLFDAHRYKHYEDIHFPQDWMNWKVCHLVGDERFAKFLRGQPKERVEYLADSLSSPAWTYPISVPLLYLSRYFPKTYEALYGDWDVVKIGAELRDYAQGRKFYEATIAGKPVALFYSEKGYELPKDRPKYAPAVAGFPQLSALRVMFGDRRVDVPVEKLRHIFCPYMETAFVPASGYTLVAISSDAKTVVCQIANRDGQLDPFRPAWQTITIGEDGSVICRSPRWASSAPPVSGTMATAQDKTEVRFADNATAGLVATLKKGERFIAAGTAGGKWRRVLLMSGLKGYVPGKSVVAQPAEPLMKLAYNGKYSLAHETQKLEHAGGVQGVDYSALAESAVAGDGTALGRLASAGSLMDEQAIEGHQMTLWVILHRAGDEAFAKALAQQPRAVVAEVQKEICDPSLMAPFLDPFAYLKLHFPKSYDVLVR
jgi:hypothetical protein